MTLKVDIVALPSWMAPALVNGDYSGLQENDQQAVRDMIAELGPWYVVATEGEPYYQAMHELQNYVIHCVDDYGTPHACSPIGACE